MWNDRKALEGLHQDRKEEEARQAALRAQEKQGMEQKQAQKEQWAKPDVNEYDRQALSSAEYKPTLSELDNQQRAMIKEKAQDNPKAQEWLKHDEQAQKAEQSKHNLQQEINKRESPNYVQEAMEKREAVRDQYKEHIKNQPGLIDKMRNPDAMNEWQEGLKSLRSAKNEADDLYKSRLEKSHPEAIDGLKERFEQRHNQAEEAIKARQGIATLPSETFKREGKLNIEEHLKQVNDELKPSQVEQANKETISHVQSQVATQTVKKKQAQTM